MKNLTLLSCVLFLFACSTTTPSLIDANGAPLMLEEVDGNYLKLENGKRVLIKSLKNNKESTLVLVRHAEKQKGKDPKLTEEGIARAKKLKQILQKLDITEVCSSNYNRTKDTGQPTATQKGLTINYYDPRQQNSFFETYQTTGLNKNVLIVGHSNTIPALLNYFTQTEAYQNLPEDRYDRIFIVALKKVGEAEVMELRF